MARPRTPTAILEAKGAFIKDPQRKRARQNEPTRKSPVGDPPEYFDEDHRAIWFEFVNEASPGVLERADRKLLEVAVRITRKMRVVPGKMSRWLRFLGGALKELGMPEVDVAEFQSALRSGLGVSSQELSLLTTCFTRMGMTPADRSKVSGAPEEEEKSEWDGFGTIQ